MSDGNFAPWVEPTASKLAESRKDINDVVRQVPGTAWDEPSDYPGWSYKDHLAHLPYAHFGVHEVLRAVISGRKPDFSRFDRIDDLNEENRRKHVATPVETLLAAYLAESEATQGILSELNDEHAEVSLGPMKISQALQGFAMHDIAHGDEIKKALES